jgi:hypothetical protein
MDAARDGLRKIAEGAAPTDAKPADPPPQAVKVEAAPTPEDKEPAPDKAIEAIEKRDKRAREALAAEKAAAKAELEAERAEIARLRAEMTGKVTPFEELQKLAKTPGKELELLKKLGIETEDDHERYARNTYAVSKSGKADPKNKAYADQVSEKAGLAAEIAELRATAEELRNEFKTRDQRAAMEQFQNKWLDGFKEAPPATFASLALTSSPEKARAAFLRVGQRLEAETGETPTHAEVLAAYEDETKADLRDRGLNDEQIALMLKPKTAAKPVAPVAPPRTLDVSTGPTTTTVTTPTTREQKIAAARAGRLKLNAATT